MDGIAPLGRVNSNGHFQPMSPEQQRAQKFRERANLIYLGRPQFKLSKKTIDKATKKLNKEVSYWYLESKMGETPRSTDTGSTYGESDIESNGSSRTTPRTPTNGRSPRGDQAPTSFSLKLVDKQSCGAIAE